MTNKYRVVYSAKALRALSEQLPPKIADAVYVFIEGPLAENPKRVGKQLRGKLFPAYSARRGSYRIIYDVLEDEILIEVLKIDHRADVYRPD